MIDAAAASPALWYLTRGTGTVTLVLLSASVVFGVVEVQRWSTSRVPRFAVATLHRSLSLLVVALLAVHVATAVIDTFAPIALLDAVVPFQGAYRPLWLGLGAVALDLLLALTVTSLVRRRLGLSAWRRVHWAAYACWPVAVVHGLGTGSDSARSWMLVLTMTCVAAVTVAATARLARGWPGQATARLAGVAAVTVALAVGVVWARQGPLALHWARRAGTPVRLLVARAVVPVRRRTVPAGLAAGFSGPVTGTMRSGRSRGGSTVVELLLHTQKATISVRLAGSVADAGGVVLRTSAVSVGPIGKPARFRGRVSNLAGDTVEALVASTGGAVLDVGLGLRLTGSQATGNVTATPVAGRVG
jgi:sulfoxide reductase heme-binding subunit YedZ